MTQVYDCLCVSMNIHKTRVSIDSCHTMAAIVTVIIKGNPNDQLLETMHWIAVTVSDQSVNGQEVGALQWRVSIYVE